MYHVRRKDSTHLSGRKKRREYQVQTKQTSEGLKRADPHDYGVSRQRGRGGGQHAHPNGSTDWKKKGTILLRKGVVVMLKREEEVPTWACVRSVWKKRYWRSRGTFLFTGGERGGGTNK